MLDKFWKIVVEIYASRCYCYMGIEQRTRTFVYFGDVSDLSYFFGEVL